MKKKKFKVRPVDMCIYIDTHIYEPNFDVDLIFEYLQDLYYALSIKKRFFNTAEEYEGYSIYAATQAYMRLTNEKQFLPDGDPKKIAKVKSILNWIKRTLYAFKVDYQKLNYNDVYKEDYHGQETNDDIKLELSNNINDINSKDLNYDMELYFNKLCKLIYKIVKETPYANDKLMVHRLYISSLISLLKGFTLSNNDKYKILSNNISKAKNIDDDSLNKMYYKANQESPTSFHMDKNMEDYVFVLVNKIRKEIAKDICDIVQSHLLSEDIIENILMAPLSELNENAIEE